MSDWSSAELEFLREELGVDGTGRTLPTLTLLSGPSYTYASTIPCLVCDRFCGQPDAVASASAAEYQDKRIPANEWVQRFTRLGRAAAVYD